MDFRNATETEILGMTVTRDEALMFAASIVKAVASSDADYFQIFASTITDPEGNVGGSVGFGSVTRDFSIYSDFEVRAATPTGVDLTREDLSLIDGPLTIAGANYKAYREKAPAVIEKLRKPVQS